jgi:hypothetical protein
MPSSSSSGSAPAPTAVAAAAPPDFKGAAIRLPLDALLSIVARLDAASAARAAAACKRLRWAVQQLAAFAAAPPALVGYLEALQMFRDACSDWSDGSIEVRQQGQAVALCGARSAPTAAALLSSKSITHILRAVYLQHSSSINSTMLSCNSQGVGVNAQVLSASTSLWHAQAIVVHHRSFQRH